MTPDTCQAVRKCNRPYGHRGQHGGWRPIEGAFMDVTEHVHEWARLPDGTGECADCGLPAPDPEGLAAVMAYCAEMLDVGAKPSVVAAVLRVNAKKLDPTHTYAGENLAVCGAEVGDPCPNCKETK